MTATNVAFLDPLFRLYRLVLINSTHEIPSNQGSPIARQLSGQSRRLSCSRFRHAQDFNWQVLTLPCGDPIERQLPKKPNSGECVLFPTGDQIIASNAKYSQP